MPGLRRDLGLPSATLLGLGSILGTGVFVSIAMGAGLAGSAVLIAIALAAGVATCNGLSSAQLAAAHPVSGGTYEYGYEFLTPSLGFTAGWAFLLAKSASAATAALGCAGYLLHLMRIDAPGALVPLAFGIASVITLLVAGGVRRSARINAVIVLITLIALVIFIVLGARQTVMAGMLDANEILTTPVQRILEATALMFVAYTGYGRIATLGEEVRDPARTIPRAIIVTLLVSMALYLAVATAGLGSVGAEAFARTISEEAAPLESVARIFAIPAIPQLVAAGAITAMLGVLLNLILGLSRVALAMGRRDDLPRFLSRVHEPSASPVRAVLVTGAVVALLTLVGDVRLTWSFSAVAVLIYYAITNAAALRLPRERRLYPRWIAWTGLIACLALVFWINWWVWSVAFGALAAGFVVRFAVHRLSRRA